MADPTHSPPLTRASVQAAHARIKQYIHLTPVLTSKTISTLASTPAPRDVFGKLDERPAVAGSAKASPNIRLFFKCENYQKVGAFKARGAFHALSRLTEEELAKGVITHSSGKSILTHLRIYLQGTFIIYGVAGSIRFEELALRAF